MVRRSTWVLLGIFIVLVGFTWYFQRNQSEKTITETTVPTVTMAHLYNLDSTQVNEVMIADGIGNKIDLYRDQETLQWAVKDIPLEEVNSFQIESVLAQFYAIQSMETLTQTVPYDSIGLADPTYTIMIKTSDGSESITYVGTQTAIGNGYYVRIGDGAVNIVEKVALDEVLNLVSTPPLVVTATPEAGLPAENEPIATPTQ
jgi:hypothetical protein